MKKLLIITLLLGISACAPKPPCCSNKADGMRPINPDHVTIDQMTEWEKQKSAERTAMLNNQETYHD